MHVRVFFVTVDCIIRLARRMPAKDYQWIRAIERLRRRVAIEAHAYASDNVQRVAYASDTVVGATPLRPTPAWRNNGTMP